MIVSFAGVGQVCATFLGGGLTEGHVVKLTGSGTVGSCEADDAFCGAAVCCKDDACTVQVGGFLSVGYSGTAPDLGWVTLAADGLGGVKTAAGGGVRCLAAEVDAAAKTVTIML